MAQLLKSVASWSMLQPWRAACFQGIWKIRADCEMKRDGTAPKGRRDYSTPLNRTFSGVCVCVKTTVVPWWRGGGGQDRTGAGSTWSSQLTPGYLPDWICSSSHGLSLSRPACCMLRVCSSLTGDSKNFALLLSSGGIISRVGTPDLLALPIRGKYSALSAALHDPPRPPHKAESSF